MLIPKTPKEPTLNDIQLTWLLLNVELMRLEKLPQSRLEPKDVFLIAPFNHQRLELLKSLIAHPKATEFGVTDEVMSNRVGTVDKAQGDQVPVVLVSYTSSSAEDIPRGMEFLYSKNRFNVAVSRAQALVVVFASPRLLDVHCKTIGQVKLANMLCRYAEVADST